MAEHVIIDEVIENGIDGDPKSPEEKEHFLEIQEALSHAKSLGNREEKAEYLFENAATGEFIFDRACQMATEAIYIEKDETVFSLKEIDEHFSDIGSSADSDEVAEEEEVSLIVPAATKKQSYLN